jgi:hypothetical protein
MVFNATFNNISATCISLQLILLVEVFNATFNKISVISWWVKLWVSNPTHGEVYSIQHYMIKFISDLRQQTQRP